MSATVVSTTKHKYKWRFQEIFSVIFFVAIPVALYFFTPLVLFLSAGTISLAIAAFLVYIGASRKKNSALTATLYSDGVVAVGGNGYEASKNRIKLSNVSVVKWDTYAHHPTLLLLNSAGRTLKLPRRLATEEPLNTYIRKNLSKNLYVADEAKETLAEILEEDVVSQGEDTDVTAEEIVWDDSVEPHELLNDAPSDGKSVIKNEDSDANSLGNVVFATKAKGGSSKVVAAPAPDAPTTGAGFDEFGQFVVTGAVNPEASEPIQSYAGADNAGEKVAPAQGDIGNLDFLLGSQPVVNDAPVVAEPVVVVVAPQTIEDTVDAKAFNEEKKSTQRVQPRKKNRNKR